MLSNRSMPRCTVIPELPYSDVVAATKWLCDAFGLTLRIGMGSHRAQLNVGDGAVVLTEQSSAAANHARVSVLVRVDDVDSHYERGSSTRRPTFRMANVNIARRTLQATSGHFPSRSRM